MPRARRWLADHPSRWVVALETAVRLMNTLLVAAGLAVAAWALATFIQIQQAQSVSALYSLAGSRSDLQGVKCPWFVYAFGAVGLATAATGGAALGSTALRSVAWATANVWAMVLVLAAQACVGVAAWLDHSWERRLPPADEAAKRWLATRLTIVRWTAAGLALAQLLTLLLGCGLQAAYTAADEAAEDQEEEESWRRRPLLTGGAAVGLLTGGGGRRRAATSPLPGSAGASAPSGGRGTTNTGGEADEEAAWQARMRERYGLDPSQFGASAAGGPTGQTAGGAAAVTRRAGQRTASGAGGRQGGRDDDDDDGDSSDSEVGGSRCVVS